MTARPAVAKAAGRRGPTANPHRGDRVPSAAGVRRWRVWGTSVAVAVCPPAAAERACAVVRREIRAFDRACNRFRDDAELTRLNRAGGRPVAVSALLLAAVGASLRAAERTAGAVDPTVGSALEHLGYDRDFDDLAALAGRPLPTTDPGPVAGWRSVRVDQAAGVVQVPVGVHLDLGATAKALCADLAAAKVADELGVGVAVDLGGDLAFAGPPPPGGWNVAVVEDGRSGCLGPGCAVAAWGGGLASSGTSLRTWRRGGRDLHHIVDPATGWPAPARWRVVTVAAGSCVDANAASTAAVVWGEQAPFRLAQLGLPSRLVGSGGAVLEVGGWPTCAESAEGLAGSGG